MNASFKPEEEQKEVATFPAFSQPNAYDPYFFPGFPGVPQGKAKKFANEFPRAKNYHSMEAIAEAFPHLKDVNKGLSFDEKSVKDAKCFVMRSNNDDDIHKAIKYQIWISTPQNNEYLNRVYLEAKKKGQDVYLFYSVVKSGQFVGVAKMNSSIQDKNFPYWWQSHKWRGQFDLKWIFVKDVSYKFFERIYNIHNLPVIRSKDCTEIDFSSNGRQMLKIFNEQPSTRTIFQEFEYMDYREDWLMTQRNMARMYKQNYPNLGFYGGYGYMPMQMNYGYPGGAAVGGYSGIPGVGFPKEMHEKGEESAREAKKPKEEGQEEEKN